MQSLATLTQTVVEAQHAKIERNEKTTIKIALACDIGPVEVAVAYYTSSNYFLIDDS